LNTGSSPVFSKGGMVTTICWSTKDRVDYALEGVIVTCGATIEWLKNQMGLFADSRITEAMATSVADNNGVYLIPAFSGLGAPHWNMDAKALITGLTFASNKNHIVRAALESIPYQIKDVINEMEMESGIHLKELKVDGGISANSFVVQFLSDLLNTTVTNIGIADVSALGAALIAGLGAGIYEDIEELRKIEHQSNSKIPGINQDHVFHDYEGWKYYISKYI
jgi:glycerol kinase